MSEVVDAIVAELIVRDVAKYERDFDRATAAHDKFFTSTKKLQGQTFDLAKEGQKYKAGAEKIGQAEEQLTQRVARTRKKRADDAVAQDEREVASAKKAAKERSDAAKVAAKAEADAKKLAATEAKKAAQLEQDYQKALARARDSELSSVRRQREELARARESERQANNQAKASAFLSPLGARGLSGQSARSSAEVFRDSFRAEAQGAKDAARAESEVAKARDEAARAASREAEQTARLSAVAERAAARRGVAQGSGANLGRTVPREGSGQSSIPASALGAGAAAAVADESQINHLMADQAVLADRLRNTRGAEREIIREQIGELRLIKQLQSAGLADEEIALRLEQRRALIEAERVKTTRANLLGGTAKFAEGAGLARTGGGTAAIAGIATAVGIGVGVEVIQSAVEYGKALDNLSKQLGVTVEDLQAYQKIARDVGVTQEQLTSAFGQFASNLGRAQQNEQEQAKVFKALGVNIKEFASAGDALPTVIDRISQIKDPAQRAAVETRLFGEEGRKLDALLSGGAERVSELSRALQETGRALSAKEIQELDQTSRKLAEVKSQLSVDFARVVAGNSDAIIGLANSFGTLANSALNAIGRLQQFGAMQINSGFLSGFASGDQKATARKFLLSTDPGRRQLFDQNSTAISGLLGVSPDQLSSKETVATINRLISDRGPGQSQRQAQLRQLVADRREILAAQRAGKITPTPPVQTGTVNTGALRNLGTPAGPKGKSADQLEREAEQRTKQFNDQLAQAQADFLRAQEQMTGSVERRAEIEQQLLKTAYEARLADIDSQAKRNKLAGADAKLEDARAAELKAAEKKAFDAQASAIEQDKQLEIARALTQKQQDLLDVQQTLLGAQLAVAQSASKRREIELALLANAKEQERNRLNGIIAAAKPGDPSIAAAQAQLGSLDQRFDAQRRTTEFANRGPLKQYLDALPRTADQVNEALENAAVGGLQSLNDGLTEAIKNFLHLSGAAGDFLGQLIQIGIQRELLIPLANELFPTGDASGGILSGLAGLFGGGGGGGGASSGLAALGGLLGGARASGGNVVAGVPYLVGEHGPEPVVFGASGRVFPNGALPSLRGATGGLTVLAPQHFDLSGVVMTESLIRKFEASNRQYADAVAAQAGRAAVAAGPGRLKQLDTLGN